MGTQETYHRVIEGELEVAKMDKRGVNGSVVAQMRMRVVSEPFITL